MIVLNFFRHLEHFPLFENLAGVGRDWGEMNGPRAQCRQKTSRISSMSRDQKLAHPLCPQWQTHSPRFSVHEQVLTPGTYCKN